MRIMVLIDRGREIALFNTNNNKHSVLLVALETVDICPVRFLLLNAICQSASIYFSLSPFCDRVRFVFLSSLASAGVEPGELVGAAAEHQVPLGHAAVPLLALQSRLPRAHHLPLQVAVREGQAGLRGPHANLRLPLAGHAQVRQVPAGQRHVHLAAVHQQLLGR